MKVEIRSDKSSMTVQGYVNIPGRNSRCLIGQHGLFVESIVPGAFARAITTAVDPIGLEFNHARQLDDTNGNLELFEDQIGLYARAVVTDSEVIEAAVEGQLTGWSFGFIPLKDTWTDGEPQHRSVEELELLEVSILTKTPAYLATKIEARGGKDVLKESRGYSDEAIEVFYCPEKEETRAEETDVNLTEVNLLNEWLEIEQERY